MTETQQGGTYHLERSVVAVPSSVGLMRDLAEVHLTKWGTPRTVIDDALLMLSELSTNAVTATPARMITVRIVREAASVLLAVWDSSSKQPIQRPMTEPSLETLDLDPAHFDDNGGHGLAIVAALAVQYGCEPTGPSGKWIWARLRA